MVHKRGNKDPATHTMRTMVISTDGAKVKAAAEPFNFQHSCYYGLGTAIKTEKSWDLEVSRPKSYEIEKSWDQELLRPRHLETEKSGDLGLSWASILETKKFWDQEVSRPRFLETEESRDWGVLRPKSLETRKSRDQEVSKPRSLKTQKSRDWTVSGPRNQTLHTTQLKNYTCPAYSPTHSQESGPCDKYEVWWLGGALSFHAFAAAVNIKIWVSSAIKFLFIDSMI